jgi:hypothetical protein
MNEQKEVIIWHKYPDDKPSKKYDTDYKLVTMDESGLFTTQVVWAKHKGRWGFHYEDDVGYLFGNLNRDVVAWAEMPMGWKEEKSGR